MMEYAQINKKAEQYIKKLFNEEAKENLVFHSLEHTQYVVEKATEMARFYQLNEREMSIIHVAAWFHDAGYLFAAPKEHEEKSVELMQAFIQPYHVDDEFLNEVSACIMATKYPREPKSQLQEIICDADTFNFGTKDFKDTNKRFFKEVNYFDSNHVSKEEFNKQAYKMLEEHKYFTDYGRDLLNARKQANMEKLKEKYPILAETNGPEIKEKNGTTKGMQTMLRLTSSNHIQLSEMADSKANILISVNAIIISLILSILLRKLQTDPYLTIPTIIFLLVSVTTIVLAILATRPKITLGTFNEEDVLNKKTNLLFFGNFYKVELATYEKAMRTMMNDSDYLYRSIIKDIYFLGVVLGRKYKLLRLAYNIFMIGIIVSVLAFAIASILYTAPPAAASVTNGAGSPF